MHQLSQAAGYQRIAGYDLARGIAVFVMLFINFREVFALQDVSWPWLSDAIALFNRRAAVVLVMVSGAGVSLIFRNMGAKSRRILLDRAVFLFLAGGLLSRIWSADILHFYAVFICAGLFFVSLSRRKLLAGILLFWLVSFIQFFEVYDRVYELQDKGPFWGQVQDVLFTGYYPVFPWMVFFLTGMLLGRFDLQKPDTHRSDLCGPDMQGWGICQKVFATGVVLLIVSEIISYLLAPAYQQLLFSGSSGKGGFGPAFKAAFIWFTHIDLSVPTPFSVVSGIGTGLSVIAVSHGLVKNLRPGLQRPLIRAGQSSLTLYIFHIVIMVSCVEIWWTGAQGIAMATSGALVFFLLYSAALARWLEKKPRGPVEIFMRIVHPSFYLSYPLLWIRSLWKKVML